MKGWLFTNILAVYGCLYGVINPFAGLIVFYVFAILRPQFMWDWAFDQSNPFPYSQLVGGAVLIGLVFQGFGRWDRIKGAGWPVIGLSVYLISGLIGTFLVAPSIAPWAVGRAWEYWLVQFKIGLMTILAVAVIREAKQIRILAWSIMASIGYLGFEFNYQYKTSGGFNRILDRGFGGIDNNGVAMIMVAGVPLAYLMGIADRRLWVTGACLAAAFLESHEVYLTYSRGGFLGLGLVWFGAMVIGWLLLPRKGLTITTMIVLAVGLLMFAGQSVQDEFFSIFVKREELDASAASRFDTWGAAWRCMLDNPLGVGPRNFNLISDRYGLARNKSVHSLYLQTGADYGFLGLIGLMVFYVGTLTNTMKLVVSPVAKRMIWPQFYGVMVSLSLAGFLVCSTFIGMESVEVAYIIGALGLCLVAYVNRVAESVSVESLPELQEVPLPDSLGQLAPSPA